MRWINKDILVTVLAAIIVLWGMCKASNGQTTLPSSGLVRFTTPDSSPPKVGVNVLFDVYDHIPVDTKCTDVAVVWSFGDNTPAVEGWSINHVFDTPGTFTVSATLSFWNKTTLQYGATARYVTQLVVGQGGRSVYFISPSGSDSNPGTQDKPFKTVDKVRSLLSSKVNNLEFHFQSGGFFTTSNEMYVKGSNVFFGMYGGSVIPTIYRTGTGNVFTVVGARGVTIRNMLLNTPYIPSKRTNGKPPVGGIQITNARGVAMQNLKVDNLNIAIANFGGRMVLIENSQTVSVVSCGGNFLWSSSSADDPNTEAWDVSVINCTVLNSTREHDLRFAGSHHLSICLGLLNNEDRRDIAHGGWTNSPVGGVDNGDYNKKSIVLQNGSEAYISRLRLGSYIDNSTDTTPNSDNTGYGMRGPASKWVNSLTRGNQFSNTYFEVLHNSFNVVIRENQFWAPAPGNYNNSPISIAIVKMDQNPLDVNRPMDVINVERNERWKLAPSKPYGTWLYPNPGTATHVTIQANVDH